MKTDKKIELKKEFEEKFTFEDVDFPIKHFDEEPDKVWEWIENLLTQQREEAVIKYLRNFYKNKDIADMYVENFKKEQKEHE